jgi:peroxiredoxin
VSFDAVSNNASFCDNNEFTYDLWSDLDRELAQYYGIVDSASALFPSRKTVVLSPEGDWLLIYENPSIPDGLSGHGRVVREDIEAIIAAND